MDNFRDDFLDRCRAIFRIEFSSVFSLSLYLILFFLNHSFQFALVSTTVYWLVLAWFCAFPWHSIEDMNKIDNVNWHVNLAGLFMSYVYMKQLMIPIMKWMSMSIKMMLMIWFNKGSVHTTISLVSKSKSFTKIGWKFAWLQLKSYVTSP